MGVTDGASGGVRMWGECSGASVYLVDWAMNDKSPAWACIVGPPIEPGSGGFIHAFETVGELGKDGWIVRLSDFTLELVPFALRCSKAKSDLHRSRAKRSRRNQKNPSR